jgi:predicted methyltransferase
VHGRGCCFVAACLGLTACATVSAVTPPEEAVDYRLMVSAPDRTAADRALDAGRKPAEFLAFMQVRAGMAVAELGAGGGYTTELLARAVGPGGIVYGQNSTFILDRFAAKPWAERLARPENSNVVRLDREFDDPFPSDIKPLDLVVINAFYHDTVWMNVDRRKMNQAVFGALKSGGHYVVVDSSTVSGAGIEYVKSLHRIGEEVVREEVERAGFKLEQESDFLRNPRDKRDWSTSPGAAGEKRGSGDRFALRFVKP